MGQTVFNSPTKRKGVFTAYNAFKKKRNADFREYCEKIPESVLKEEFDNLPREEDGAGPHQDATYLREKKRLFDERGWLIFNQPSQSPVTNVHDACIFPMLSKEVSKVQALKYGSIMLKGDELYHAVSTAWNNSKNHVAMSRAFAGHHQIVCSIIEHNGDNTYLTEKGGLSFGLRRKGKKCIQNVSKSFLKCF